MAQTDAIISTNAVGEPEVGPEIPTVLRTVVTPKRGALIGWNHQTDTPNGLRSGKVWCWVSEHDHLQVYDENFNRSKKAGEVRFCGVANFTMVRMFHPYWSLFGRAPRDMNSKDKRRCRRKYKQLMRLWRINNNLPVDEDPENEIQPSQPDGPRRRKRGRPSKRSTGGAAPRPRKRRQVHVPPATTGTEEEIAGYTADNPRTISDDEDSDWNDNIPLLQRSRPDTGKPRLGNITNVINSIFGNKPKQGLEEGAEDVKEEDVAQGTVQNTSAATASLLADAPALRARSICTPVLNPISDQTSEIDRQPQTTQDSASTPLQIDDDDTQFTGLRNALTEHFNASSQEKTQGTTQQPREDDFKKELEAAATMVEGEAEVKKDEDRVVTFAPCPITPMSEVIVIDD